MGRLRFYGRGRSGSPGLGTYPEGTTRNTEDAPRRAQRVLGVMAVTVVGLRTVGDDHASTLSDDHDDEVDLWEEIPRSSSSALAPAAS